ncbi:dirigent protein 11 [Phtheirospermum japonicum]|uniref:Dirigent protein n=1 Tax=Phtheirospermum japonicum TaxID=374723 RepID=A0A830D0S1_9LAMI|nr:dirigent protein 11 [Phtheirospermum japonicum]
MDKLYTFLILSSLFIAAANAISREEPNEAEKWVQNYLSQPKEKVAKLHFYVQDVLGGPNATIFEVARSEITSTSPRLFGQVRVLDDLITAGPDRNSMKLGRLQGLITSADLRVSGLAMNVNFVFTAGPYEGNTLCMLGRNPIDSSDRELPIVGGTGVFRMARGFSVSNTYSYDPVENYGVLEYTLYVFHV